MKNTSKKCAKSGRKKYAGGTSITNYIEDPSEALAQNQINIAKAQYEGATNPWVLGTKGAGALMTGVGEMLGGTEALAGFAQKGITKLIKAGGGTVNSQVPVEVEGEEVGEMPNGQLLDFQGPSHEQGGIDANLPEGTEIYSKRIQIDGKTMADRKKARESIVSRYTKKSDKGDFIAGNSLKRIKVATEKEEAFDRAVQDAIHKSLQTQGKSLVGREQHGFNPVVGSDNMLDSAYGKPLTEDGANPNEDTRISTVLSGTEKTEDVAGTGFQLPQFTGGDFLNVAGNIFQGVAPYLNTLNNRATDTPNINPYKDYGKEGIDKLAQGEQFLKQNLDEGMKSLEGNRVAATRQGRNSARGVNTMRALDLAAYEGANKQEGNLYANYANEMTSQLAREAQAEDTQDRVVMGGEGARDLADRQDKDAFASAVSEGLRGLGMTAANAGKQLNEAKTRDTMYDLLETNQFGFNKSTNAIIGKAVKAGNIDTSKYPTKDSLITDLFNKGLLPQYKTLEEALKIK